MEFRDNSALINNLQNEKIRAEWMAQNLIRSQKYKMFFAGLIFAIISFIGAHPIQTSFLWLKISEVISSFSLLFAGIFLLLRLSEISYKEIERISKLSWMYNAIFNSLYIYWILFLIGIFLLVFNRAVLLLVIESK